MKQIDLSFVNDALGEDKDAIKEMLIALKEMSHEYTANMSLALHKNDYESISQQAHKMINPCSMFGLKEFSRLIINIELSAKKNINFEEIKNDHNLILELILHLNNEIDSIINPQ